MHSIWKSIKGNDALHWFLLSGIDTPLLILHFAGAKAYLNSLL